MNGIINSNKGNAINIAPTLAFSNFALMFSFRNS